jgi:adenine-specific DNA glycosylase
VFLTTLFRFDFHPEQLLFIYDKPEPLLDVNMSRVLERYFGSRQLVDIRYDPYLQNLAKDVTNYSDSTNRNFAILDFAALICTNRYPKCNECPVNTGCQYNLSNMRTPLPESGQNRQNGGGGTQSVRGKVIFGEKLGKYDGENAKTC